MKRNTIAISIIMLFCPALAFAQGAYKGFPAGNCTNYAAQRFDSMAPSPKLNWHGNAAAWLPNAQSAGWRVSTNAYDARPQSIIVWNDGGYGHVGWVEQVNNGRILVWEMNWTGFGKVSSVWLPISNLNRGKYRFAGYVFASLASRYTGPTRFA